MKPSTIVAGIAVFVALGAVGSGLFLYKKHQFEAAMSAPPMPEPAEAAILVEARRVPWQPMSDLVGTAFSLRSVRMSNELAGTVKEVRFQSGSVVEAGQPLLTLDDSTARADLEAAEAAVRVAQASVDVGESKRRLAESEWNRVKEAGAQNAATPTEIDRRRAEVDQAVSELERLRAEVDQAQARVEQVKVRVAKHVIRAPFRGRAGIRNVHEGQYLAEGTTFVLLEEVADKIYLDFAIPQEYLARVAPGLTVLATCNALGDQPLAIEVVAVDATVNNDTRNVRVRGIVDNHEGRIRPGMFVQIRVPTEATKEYVVVPATAIRRATVGDHVWVVAPAESPDKLRAKQRAVKLGPSVGEDVIVLEGLQPGERIAAGGSFKMREGVLVFDASKPPSAPGANPAAKETAAR
ncbi:MAG: efflux RND transporter periplasmic adaptor subunit [Phycisphaerales bacterium]